MEIENLRDKGLRKSTRNNYYRIWRIFNKFLIKLDAMPKEWEQRTALFCTHLILQGTQSSTIKSYISAIKAILQIYLNYKWNEGTVLLSTLTKACRLENNRVKNRFPIHFKLLEVILFEVNRTLPGQPFLSLMYKTIFVMAYYGLFCIGELTSGNSSHTIKARNVHVASNKDKILVILYSSKMHGLESIPQKVKITSATSYAQNKLNQKKFSVLLV